MLASPLYEVKMSKRHAKVYAVIACLTCLEHKVHLKDNLGPNWALLCKKHSGLGPTAAVQGLAQAPVHHSRAASSPT